MNNQLFNAVYYNNLLNVQQLVLNGADVNCRNYDRSTLLYFVRSLEIAQFLVLNGAAVNCRNNFGDTPLHSVRSLEITQFLVLNGADVNCQNNNGNTPLHTCASIHNYYGCIKNIKILLEYGADMHIKNNVGKSAYDYAIYFECNEIIELFEHYNAISNGLDIKEPCVE